MRKFCFLLFREKMRNFREIGNAKSRENAKIYQKIYCKICAKNNAKLPEKECENSSKKTKIMHSSVKTQKFNKH